MISKFAVFGKDRGEAIERMRRALAEYEVGGIKTTLPFFREIMEDDEFIDGKLDTRFIPRFLERKKEASPDDRTIDMAIIAAARAYANKQYTASTSMNGDQQSPSRWVLSGRAAMKGRSF
jgi:acetyl-CoA carboxylase biotin carboxylase subunit